MAGIGVDLAMVAGMGGRWGLLVVIMLDSEVEPGLHSKRFQTTTANYNCIIRTEDSVIKSRLSPADETLYALLKMSISFRMNCCKWLLRNDFFTVRFTHLSIQFDTSSLSLFIFGVGGGGDIISRCL